MSFIVLVLFNVELSPHVSEQAYFHTRKPVNAWLVYKSNMYL